MMERWTEEWIVRVLDSQEIKDSPTDVSAATENICPS